MSNRKFSLPRAVNAKEAYEHLNKNLRSPKIKAISYDSQKDIINIKSTFYNLKVSVNNGNVKIGGRGNLLCFLAVLTIFGIIIVNINSIPVYSSIHQSLQSM